MNTKRLSSLFSSVGFLSFKGIAWLIRKTSFKILYFKSGIIAFILFNLIPYRRKLVRENLENSFPGKSITENQTISRKYYVHLVDLIFEVLKIPAMDEEQFRKRCKILNPGLSHDLISRKKNIIFVGGHCGNFEWVGQQILCFAHPGLDHYNGIVKPLSDKRFEQFLHITIREAFHNNLAVNFKNAYRKLISQRGSSNITFLVADQTPHESEINYWTRFLNQDTAFFLGTEKMAKALDLAVVFVHVTKPKRGFYELRLELITDNPKETAEFEITEKHIRLLEEDIIKQPEIWLWSHRRWKYKKEEKDRIYGREKNF